MGKSALIENEYRHNPAFKRYVDRYSIRQGITVEEALEHKSVRQMYLRCTDV